MVFSKWVGKVYKQFAHIIKRSSSELALGTCLVDEQGGEARFRLHSDTGNIRFYFSLLDFKYVVICFGTTEKAVQMPEQKDMVPEISTVSVDDTKDIASTSLYFVNKVLGELDELSGKKMLCAIAKYVERKAKE